MTSSSVISSSTNLTSTDLGLKPGLSGERPATECPSNENTLLKQRLTWSVSKESAFTTLYTHTAPVVKSTQFIYSEKISLCSGTIQNSQKQTVGRKYDYFNVQSCSI